MRILKQTLIVMALTAGMVLVIGYTYIWRASADTSLSYEPGESVNVLQHFVDAVDYESQKYPGMGDVEIRTVWMGIPNMYARSGYVGIEVNQEWTEDDTSMTASVALDVAQNFYRGGCDPIATIAVHEFAHVLDARSGFEARDELTAALGTTYFGDLSGYSYNSDGTVNVPEALANAFQAEECGTANAQEMQLYSMLAYW